MSFLYFFICCNVDIAPPESVIRIRGTRVRFSMMATFSLLNSREKLKITSENIPIILVGVSKCTGEFFVRKLT